MRFFSYEEIDELGEGLIRQYLGKGAERTCRVDIEGFVTDFLKLPLYGAEFGTGAPYAVLPHDLPDQVKIWPSPPDRPGADLYFTGHLARLVDSSDTAGLLADMLREYGVTLTV